jgi:hypothetical protein
VAVQSDIHPFVWVWPCGEAARAEQITSGPGTVNDYWGFSWTPDPERLAEIEHDVRREKTDLFHHPGYIVINRERMNFVVQPAETADHIGFRWTILFVAERLQRECFIRIDWPG